MPKTGVNMPTFGLFKVLTDEELEIIDNAAYRIIKDVGVYIDDAELLKMAEKMGCSIDYGKKVAKGMPEYTVRDMVSKAPRNFVLAARSPEWDLIFDGPGRKQFWAPESGATDKLEWDENKKAYNRKRAGAKDTLYGAKIVDGIDDFDFNIYLYDAAEEGQLGLPSELHKMNAMFQGTSKFAGNACTTVSDIKEHDYVARLGAEVVGGAEELAKRPLFWEVYNYIGTLQLNRFNSWSLRAAIKYHIPIMPAVTSGAPLTGPAMAAGNTAISLAGVLFMIALQQCYDPGTAAIANNIVFPLSPTGGKGSISAHGPLGCAAMNQLMHEFYHLPTCEYAGTYDGSLDEMAFNLMRETEFQQLIGTDMLLLQFAPAALDPRFIVAAAEIAHQGRYFYDHFDEIHPTAENLALDVIKQIGAKGEKWMTNKYNIDRLKRWGQVYSLDSRPVDGWLAQGSPSWLYDLCTEKLKELEKHEPKPLPNDVVERMNAIVKEGDEKLKVGR